MKVSFDFDDTLDNIDVQSYAKYLLDKNIEVWICTARFSDEDAPSEYWNLDLYKIAEIIGIPKQNIYFSSYEDKYIFFENKDFLWHLDDSEEELDMINSNTNTIGINVKKSNWKEKCEKIIKYIEK